MLAAPGRVRVTGAESTHPAPGARNPRALCQAHRMRYERMPIEIESPEQMGYGSITCNLTESSFADASLDDLGLDLAGLVLAYGDHLGHPGLREVLAADPGAGAVAPGRRAGHPGGGRRPVRHLDVAARAGQPRVVAAPNYATNIVTPRAIGADIELLELRFEDGYRPRPRPAGRA